MSSVSSKEELHGIERTVDGYFKSPALRFGYGKRTVSLTVNKVQHILQAVEDNGVEAVLNEMRAFVAGGKGVILTKSAPIPTKSKGVPLKVKQKTAVLAPPPEEMFDFDLGEDEEPDDIPMLG